MNRSQLDNFLKREMTRKDFLGFSALTIASLFGIVGTITELLSHAATPYASEEAESGTLSGNTALTSDSTASGGKAVQFGASTANAYAAAVAALPSLELWLPFDEAEGVTATDHSTNGYNGSYSSTGVTYSVTDSGAGSGTDAKAVTLSTNATISIPNHPALRLSTTSTSRWSLRVRVGLPTSNTGPANNPGYPLLLSMGDLGKGTSASGFQIFGTATIGFVIGNAQSALVMPTSLEYSGSTPSLQDLAFVWDGTIMNFYMNGLPVGSDATVLGQAVSDTTNPLIIGPNLTVDQLIISESAWTAAQVASLTMAYTESSSGGGGGNGDTNIPNAPSGPTAPSAGYRLVFADDFVGTSLDLNRWNPTRTRGMTAGLSDPYNNWEFEIFDSKAVTVANSNLVITCTPQAQAGKNYTSGTVEGGLAATPFLFSPAHAGTLYVQAKIKVPGDAPGSNGSVFPAYWAVTYLTYGQTTGGYTREMDFFEFGLQPRPGQRDEIDSTQLAPPNGYGTGSTGNVEQLTATLPFDPASAFHVYTVQINSNGSFTLWIDGAHKWDMGAWPAIDWMGIILNYSIESAPATNFTSDTYECDYVAVWQDAGVAQGSGIMNSGIAAGTNV